MFDDLDLSLKAILADAAVQPVLAGVDVSFRTPDRNFAPAVSTLDLFLYGVAENRVLRDPEPVRTIENGVVRRARPPLRIDCDYLVTAWSRKPDALRVAEERLMLANALLKLSRFPTIPQTYLRNALAGQPFPPQMWVAQTEDGKNLGEFWTALGVPPRTSFHLSVTIAMPFGTSEVEGPAVQTREAVLHDGPAEDARATSVFTIGGVVRDAAGPVGEASVEIDGRRPATTTDTGGRFRLTGVTAGDHTLRATAPSHVPTDTAITVPADALDGYDVTFPP